MTRKVYFSYIASAQFQARSEMLPTLQGTRVPDVNKHVISYMYNRRGRGRTM